MTGTTTSTKLSIKKMNFTKKIVSQTCNPLKMQVDMNGEDSHISQFNFSCIKPAVYNSTRALFSCKEFYFYNEISRRKRKTLAASRPSECHVIWVLLYALPLKTSFSATSNLSQIMYSSHKEITWRRPPPSLTKGLFFPSSEGNQFN